MELPRVLVVDDDPSIRRVLRLSFPSSSFQVVTAEDGVDALQQIDEAPVDAIVLDLEMPEMDGRTFFTTLRRRGSTVPVLILSAYGASGARRELGAEAAMRKPFDPDELVSEVKRLIDDHSSRVAAGPAPNGS